MKKQGERHSRNEHVSGLISSLCCSVYSTWLRRHDHHRVGAEACQAGDDASVKVHVSLHHADVGLLAAPRVGSDHHHLGASRGRQLWQKKVQTAESAQQLKSTWFCSATRRPPAPLPRRVSHRRPAHWATMQRWLRPVARLRCRVTVQNVTYLWIPRRWAGWKSPDLWSHLWLNSLPCRWKPAYQLDTGKKEENKEEKQKFTVFCNTIS